MELAFYRTLFFETFFKSGLKFYFFECLWYFKRTTQELFSHANYSPQSSELYQVVQFSNVLSLKISHILLTSSQSWVVAIT